MIDDNFIALAFLVAAGCVKTSLKSCVLQRKSWLLKKKTCARRGRDGNFSKKSGAPSIMISADQLDNFFWLYVGKLLQPTSWIMQLFQKIWYCKFCSQGGATSMINFQSQFIQMRGDGMFVSVIVVIVLQVYIFWTETA